MGGRCRPAAVADGRVGWWRGQRRRGIDRRWRAAVFVAVVHIDDGAARLALALPPVKLAREVVECHLPKRSHRLVDRFGCRRCRSRR